jgi:hypothetical protein
MAEKLATPKLNSKVPAAGARARGRNKIEKVLRWMSWWEISTPRLLSIMLGVQHDGQRKFFKKLVTEKKYLHEIEQEVTAQKIYMLTRKGKNAALEIEEKAIKVKTQNRYLSDRYFKHNLATQRVVLKFLADDDNGGVNLGNLIANDKHPLRGEAKKGEKIPDAIVRTAVNTGGVKKGTKLAVEVELSHKKDFWVYNGYKLHLAELQKNNPDYRQVAYCFNKPQLRNRYKNKYFAKEWPVFKWVGRGYQVQGAVSARDEGRVRKGMITFLQSKLV